MNRKQFLASLVGFVGLGVLAKEAKASSPSLAYSSAPTPMSTNELPKDLREAEEVIKNEQDNSLQQILSLKDCPDYYTRYIRTVDKVVFDRLITMDLPIQNINGIDYIIVNRYPVTYF